MFKNTVTGVAVVLFDVYAVISAESMNRLVVPESLLKNNISLEAVAVARGIAASEVTMQPSEPAVTINAVLVGESSANVPAAVTTAVPVLGICAKGAVKVSAMTVP